MNILPSDDVDQYYRFAAIRLDSEYCTGISFFIASHLVHEIHAHSKFHSTHLERFDYLCSMFDQEIVWIYIPLTVQDQITAIEIRKYVTEDERPHYFTVSRRISFRSNWQKLTPKLIDMDGDGEIYNWLSPNA